MAWYDDLWSGIKSGVSSVAGVVKDVAGAVGSVAPLIPLLLKKGGKVEDFKDTPANRRKIINLYKKLHPHHKKAVEAMMKKSAPKKKTTKRK